MDDLASFEMFGKACRYAEKLTGATPDSVTLSRPCEAEVRADRTMDRTAWWARR